MSDDINPADADPGEDELTQAERLSLRGDQLAAEGLYEEAVGAYSESIERDATILSTYLKLARACYDNREYPEAEAVLQKLVALKPTDSNIYRRIIEFYLDKVREAADRNRFEESLMAARYAFNYFYPGMFISSLFGVAIETFERIDREDSDVARRRTACLYASYISAFGYQYISLSEPREPWYWYEKALQYGEPPEVRDPLELKIHYRAGMTYWYGLGNKERWRPRLTEDDYRVLPQYEEACRAFEKSVELYPVRDGGGELLSESIFPFEMLSASYIRTGRYSEAIDTLRDGLSQLAKDEKDEAQRKLRLRIIVKNLDHNASILLSEFYEYLGEYAAAIECLVKPIESRIGNKQYQAEAAGLIRRAEEIVEKHSVEQSPDIVELRRRLEAATT